MKVHFLGTGASILTPRPFCFCEVCSEAREKGVPYSRLGPSIFIEGPNILIDTPEEISYQLNRSGIRHVDVCLYSHWHPDHTAGFRVWEGNANFLKDPPETEPTRVVLTKQVRSDLETKAGILQHLIHLEQRALVNLETVDTMKWLELGGYQLLPFPLGCEHFCGYIIESLSARILVIPDEVKAWHPDSFCGELGKFDLAILPAGVFVPHPITGVEQIPPDHGVFRTNARFTEILELCSDIRAKRFILTHIYEPDGVSYEQLTSLAPEISSKLGIQLEFAYDTQEISL